MKKTFFSPGRVKVSFRKGPSGHLRRDPSEETKSIKDNPSLQDKSTPQREDLVRMNARSVVLQRGGDFSDKQEVLGEYILQFNKYKGKSFRWLLENDVGYALYRSDKIEEEEQAGQFNPDGPCKDSLISFLEYSRSFKEIEDLKRADGYAFFIMKQNCIPGSKIYKLEQYLLKLLQKQTNTPPLSSPSSSTTRPPVPSSTASDQPGLLQSPSTSAPVCRPSSRGEGSLLPAATQSTPAPMPSALTEAPVPSYMTKRGLLQPPSTSAPVCRPSSRGLLQPPSTSAPVCRPSSRGVGRPGVILGTTGQYYILASHLCCKACKRYWFADKPQWLDMLPQRFRNLLPAF
ncbi:hypothetical protein QQF64_023704 [Cirrhinus molitorella]|uniref:Uncharacterized protein n=1 Tax=Cirrhinus molitorella TaxID=172907 RepID=A0ABR3NJ64_9TELE